MISKAQTLQAATFAVALVTAVACGQDPAGDSADDKVIIPPAQCSPDRPDCSQGGDFPVDSDLNAGNSAGLRFSDETGALVVDRVSALPDIDGDGVPDDADDCPGTPDWISCDNDPSNDGIYATLFYDPSGSVESERRAIASTVADIPAIDVYFLIDARLSIYDEGIGEIRKLQDGIATIIDDIRLLYGDARFGVGLYRAYPLLPLANPYSQSPYHHILDLTADEVLVQAAVDTLNGISNGNLDGSPSAATQALYSIASGLGLGDMVPNRGSCPDTENADIGFPCFRDGALHVVLNITDAEVYNGPRIGGPEYGDPPFDGTVRADVMDLPPVEMFPEILTADDATNALDLGDLSGPGRSLTVMGMSTLFSDDVETIQAPGCIPPPPSLDQDGRDAVLKFRFGSPPSGFSARASNTHWPAANIAVFDDMALTNSLACDGNMAGDTWAEINVSPIAASQEYYLVADELIGEGSVENPGAFSISIIVDGDSPNPAWTTSNAPVVWSEHIVTELQASNIRVASVVTPKDPMMMPSDGNADARLMATETGALTKNGDQWVWELPSNLGEGLEAAVISTIALAKTDSVYDIQVNSVDNEGSPIDERDFVRSIWWDDCSVGQPLECGWGAASKCRRCDIGATADFEVVLANAGVAPTAVSQVFDFELLARADQAVDVERIPVRVMVPDALAHEFDTTPDVAFYRNEYDSTERCITPPERPKWGDLTWDGTTPGDTTIEFQIRTAPTLGELATATPALIEIPTDTTSRVLNVTNELIADGQPWGLPYIQITAVLNPTNSPPTTPTLQGWSFEFVCEAAE